MKISFHPHIDPTYETTSALSLSLSLSGTEVRLFKYLVQQGIPFKSTSAGVCKPRIREIFRGSHPPHIVID
jgi:hypothetical protein